MSVESVLKGARDRVSVFRRRDAWKVRELASTESETEAVLNQSVEPSPVDTSTQFKSGSWTSSFAYWSSDVP